jgi:hypothetical protein
LGKVEEYVAILKTIRRCFLIFCLNNFNKSVPTARKFNLNILDLINAEYYFKAI